MFNFIKRLFSKSKPISNYITLPKITDCGLGSKVWVVDKFDELYDIREDEGLVSYSDGLWYAPIIPNKSKSYIFYNGKKYHYEDLKELKVIVYNNNINNILDNLE